MLIFFWVRSVFKNAVGKIAFYFLAFSKNPVCHRRAYFKRANIFRETKKRRETRIEKNEHVVRLAALAAGAVSRVLLVFAEQQ
jgi:hypothetical protein